MGEHAGTNEPPQCNTQAETDGGEREKEKERKKEREIEREHPQLTV